MSQLNKIRLFEAFEMIDPLMDILVGLQTY